MKALPEYAPRWRESSVSRKFLLLGRIVDNLDDDLAACKGPGADIEDYRHHRYADQWTTWELYDTSYGWRADYRVFRLASCPYFEKRHLVVPAGLTELSRAWRPAMDDARDAFDNLRDNRILWGIVASIPDLIQQAIASKEAAELDAAAALCESVFNKLDTDLGPLDDCRANCGLTATLFTIAYHNLMSELCGDITDESFSNWLGDLKHYRRWIDPEAVAGKRLKTSTLKFEQRRTGPRLRPAETSGDLDELISVHRYECRAITNYVMTAGRMDDALLLRAFEVAKTAWSHARTRRITEEKHQKEKGTYDTGRAREFRRYLFLSEAERLTDTARAAKNVGLYLEEAKLLHLFCALIPPELKKDKAVFALSRNYWQLPRHVREAGLQLLTFRDDGKSSREINVSPLVEIIEFSRNEANTSTNAPTGAEGVFEQRLARDMRTYPDWKTLQGRWPKPVLWNASQYLRNLMRIFADGQDHTLSDREYDALFSIARRYGYVRSAGKLLRKFTPRVEQILDFVNDLKRCAQTTPFGWSLEKLEEWRQLLLELLIAQHEGGRPIDGLASPDRLLVHEVIMGLASSHLRGLPRVMAHKLYDTWQGSIQVDDLHELYDRELDFDRKGPATVDAARLASFARSVAVDKSSGPTHVSALAIGDGVSIVAVGADGAIDGKYLPLPRLSADIAITQEHAPLWFLSPEDPFELQVAWPESLIDFAKAVLTAAQQVQRGTEELVLAVPTSLAALPLQHLFLSVLSQSPESARKVVVSVVPNLGSLPLAWRTAEARSHQGMAWLSDEKDDCIPPVVAAVSAAGISDTEYPLPVSVVVAHGRVSSDATAQSLPSVHLGGICGDIVDAKGWSGIIQAGGIAMIDACSTGAMEAPQFLGGFGALPQLALGLGARLLIAPVKEVDPETAITFVQALFGPERPAGASVGDLYLAAIEKDPAVCLFNLYGLSSVKLDAADRTNVVSIDRSLKEEEMARAS
jgi:hypothetical protein